jgi:hypothetical protein
MSSDPYSSPGAMLGSIIADVVTMSRNAALKRRERRAARIAEEQARLEEERARRRRRAWLAAVERQARETRWAGNASEAEAHAALAGRRRNPLDRRRFR